MFILAAAPRYYKWCLSYNRVRTLMLMQATAFSFTKIDNNFAFFDLTGTGLQPTRVAKTN
jgi:hypothetical protein